MQQSFFCELSLVLCCYLCDAHMDGSVSTVDSEGLVLDDYKAHWTPSEQGTE